MNLELVLPVVWFGVIGFGVLMYVLLDGFVLGLGILMLLLALASLWAWRRGVLERTRWLLDGWRWMSPAGFIALLSGWYVVEIGRQPYVVYGLLRTSDAVSPNITAAAVMSSLIVYACAYAVIFGAGIWYLLKMIRRGPHPHETPPEHAGGEKTPARPLSVGDDESDGAAPASQGGVP